MPNKSQLSRAARLIPDMVPRWIRCYDNGGESADRYTVVFTGRYTHKTGGEHWVLAMSAAPFHPQGVGMHCYYRSVVDCPFGAWPPAIGRRCHLGLRIRFDDLPEDCQRLVISDYCYLWDLEADCPTCGGLHPVGYEGDCRDRRYFLIRERAAS